MIIYCLISIFELSQLKVEETFKFGEFFKQWVLLPLHMFQQQHNTLGPSARPLLRCMHTVPPNNVFLAHCPRFCDLCSVRYYLT